MELLYWGLGLVGLSILLVIIEVFVPSAGALAICSVIAAISGVVCLFKHDTMWGLIATLVIVVLLPAALIFALRVWPHTPMGRRIIGLRDDDSIEKEQAAQDAERRRQSAMVGVEAMVVVDLRPIGVVEVDGKRYDARSETRFCPHGTRVRVTAVEGNELKVRPQG